MTQRFREEMGGVGDGMRAMERTARGTGTALMASAGSSICGFAIMALAPMPMFSAYGILTAVMFLMAAAAALLVLPSLLLLVDPRTPTGGWLSKGRTAPREITAGRPGQQPQPCSPGTPAPPMWATRPATSAPIPSSDRPP